MAAATDNTHPLLKGHRHRGCREKEREGKPGRGRTNEDPEKETKCDTCEGIKAK